MCWAVRPPSSPVVADAPQDSSASTQAVCPLPKATTAQPSDEVRQRCAHSRRTAAKDSKVAFSRLAVADPLTARCSGVALHMSASSVSAPACGMH